jgi:Ca2+/H+ antiporter, TMEM165/GDT1 family
VEPLATAFVAALLGGWGDNSQTVAALLRQRFRVAPVVAAIVVAAAVNSLAAALAGSLLRLEVSLHAAALLLAIALAFAGVAALIGEKAKPPKARGGAWLGSLVALTAAGWGDKTQYLTAALAAYYGSVPLVAGAAFLGTVVVAMPAAVGGEAFARAAPLKPLRILFALLFLAAGGVVLVNALRLV